MPLVNLAQVPVVIGAGQSLSAAIQTNGRTPLWIDTPPGLTGTVLTFAAVGPGGDQVLRDPTGAEVTLWLGAAGCRHSLMTDIAARLAGHIAFKIRVGGVAWPEVQAAQRDLLVALRTVI